MRIKRKYVPSTLVTHSIMSETDYDIIRNGLLSNDEKTIKASIQRLISEYEEGWNINLFFRKDLYAILYDLVQHSDSKIRKWAYHLVAYIHDKNLIDRCILNLSDNKEDDVENATWIIAIASCIYDEIALISLYKEYADRYNITKSQFELCTNIFSTRSDVLKISKSSVKKIVDSDDFLSKMWLTKIYACDYQIDKKNAYSKYVDDNVMNAMIDDEDMQRYALWAFSTQRDVDLKRIRIKPYKALDLEARSQAWYFNCLFKDSQFVLNNSDYVNYVMHSFKTLSSVVQFGILRGLEMANYYLGYLSDYLIYIYNEMDEEVFEENLVLIQLIKILIKHANESQDIEDFLAFIKRKTNNYEIKKCLIAFRTTKERASMASNYNIYGSVGQINENVSVAIQNTNTTSESVGSISKDMIGILKDISERVTDGSCDELLFRDVELQNMITKLEYEFKKLNCNGNNLDEETIKRIKELEEAIDTLKKSRNKERRSAFSSVLTKISQVCTITVAVPKIVEVIVPVINHVRTFLGL